MLPSFPHLRRLLSATALGLLVACSAAPAPPPAPTEAMRHGVYVWQRQGSPGLAEAVRETSGSMDQLFVFAGELNLAQGRVSETLFPQEWDLYASAARPVVPVFRMASALESAIRSSPEAAAEPLAQMTGHVRQALGAAGIAVPGIQIDYDCPTSKLPGYTSLVEELARSLPGLEISVTALPSWLSSREFSRLAEAAHGFTLQVHGIERPAALDAPLVLCDYARIPRWIEQAAALGRPFRVALPTYTWRCVFDDAGRFVGFAGEQELPASPDTLVRLAASNPVRLAAVVQELNRRRPPNLRGIVWFRHPVPGDRWNWSWPVLRKVMDGVAPALDFSASVITPQPSLHEIHIHTPAQLQIPADLHIPLTISGRVSARDVTAGYRLVDGGVEGPAPPPGTTVRVAWFRLGAPATATATSTDTSTSATSTVSLGRVTPLW